MTDRATMQDGVFASLRLFEISEQLSELEMFARPISLALAGEFSARLRDITEHVLALEAQVRAIDVLGDRDYLGAVRDLSTDDRRAIARSALRSARGGNVVRFRGGGAR